MFFDKSNKSKSDSRIAILEERADKQSQFIDDILNKISNLNKEVWNIKELAKIKEEMIDSQNITIGELLKKICTISDDFNEFRKENNNRLRTLNNLVEEKIDIQKESTESLLIGLTKSFDTKISLLNDSRPIVTDLLKKIARLEGIADGIEHRRSTEEIIGTLRILNDQMLEAEREEKNVDKLRIKVNLLKWILGEDYED